jgi:hypothetical protein
MSTNAQALTSVPEPERLTWSEICARHPEEWVVLIDLDLVEDEAEPIRSAVVFDHHPGYGVALRRSRSQLRDDEWFVHRHTGALCGAIFPQLLSERDRLLSRR